MKPRHNLDAHLLSLHSTARSATLSPKHKCTFPVFLHIHSCYHSPIVQLSWFPYNSQNGLLIYIRSCNSTIEHSAVICSAFRIKSGIYIYHDLQALHNLVFAYYNYPSSPKYNAATLHFLLLVLATVWTTLHMEISIARFLSTPDAN